MYIGLSGMVFYGQSIHTSLKHFRECNMEKIAQGCNRETNIVLGSRVKTTPECYFFHIAQAAVF